MAILETIEQYYIRQRFTGDAPGAPSREYQLKWSTPARELDDDPETQEIWHHYDPATPIAPPPDPPPHNGVILETLEEWIVSYIHDGAVPLPPNIGQMFVETHTISLEDGTFKTSHFFNPVVDEPLATAIVGVAFVNGLPPVFSASVTITAGAGDALASGRTVSQQGDLIVYPLRGSAVAVGLAPQVVSSIASTVTAGAGSGIAAGDAPDVSGASVAAPGAGDVLFDGLSANTLIGEGVISRPGLGVVAATGLAPQWRAGVRAFAFAGDANADGLAPVIFVQGAFTAQPFAGSAIARGQAPVVTGAVNIAPGAGSALASGYPPINDIDSWVEPGLGLATLNGLAPSISFTVSVSLGVGASTADGLAPTVSVGPAYEDVVHAFDGTTIVTTFGGQNIETFD